MRSFTALVLAILLVISLAACAGTKKGANLRVKCPACGFEFEAPAEQ